MPLLPSRPQVTCRDYRREQRLLAMRRELERTDLSPERRQELEQEAQRLERSLSMN